MLDMILKRKNATRRVEITAKALTSFFVIVLAVALPQVTHLIAGAGGGVTWLPMYLPVLLGGCLLGSGYALFCGVLAPLASYVTTLAITGTAMPAAGRLPFMVAELTIFAVIGGLFSAKIAKNTLWSVPAVITAQIAGRGSFLLLVAAFNALGATPLTFSSVWAQVISGVPGLILQILIVPFVILILKRIFKED